jgi:uncharacterized membrane protein YkvA (DUF1232 family)
MDIESLNMVQRVQLVWALLRDDRVAGWLKKAGPVAILAYVLSPIDVIPDFLIGPGQVDDLGVIAIGLIVMLRLFVRFAPGDVVAEHVAAITGNRADGGYRGPRADTIETSGRVRR